MQETTKNDNGHCTDTICTVDGSTSRTTSRTHAYHWNLIATCCLHCALWESLWMCFQKQEQVAQTAKEGEPLCWMSSQVHLQLDAPTTSSVKESTMVFDPLQSRHQDLLLPPLIPWLEREALLLFDHPSSSFLELCSVKTSSASIPLLP